MLRHRAAGGDGTSRHGELLSWAWSSALAGQQPERLRFDFVSAYPGGKRRSMMTEPGGCAVDTPSEPSPQPSPRSSTFPKRPWNDVPEDVKRFGTQAETTGVIRNGAATSTDHPWVCGATGANPPGRPLSQPQRCGPLGNPNLAGALRFEHLRIPLDNRQVAIPDRRPSQDLAAATVQVLETSIG